MLAKYTDEWAKIRKFDKILFYKGSARFAAWIILFFFFLMGWFMVWADKTEARILLFTIEVVLCSLVMGLSCKGNTVKGMGIIPVCIYYDVNPWLYMLSKFVTTAKYFGISMLIFVLEMLVEINVGGLGMILMGAIAMTGAYLIVAAVMGLVIMWSSIKGM